MKKNHPNINPFEQGFVFAIASAIFFSFNVPISKILLDFVSPYWLASLLYFGAGLGTLFYYQFTKKKITTHGKVSNQTFWYGLMIILDIFAPAFLYLMFSFVAGFLIYGLSLIFYVNAQRSQGAAKVQLIQSFTPILGGILSWVFFQETLSITTVFGYVIVVIALILLGIDSRKGQPN